MHTHAYSYSLSHIHRHIHSHTNTSPGTDSEVTMNRMQKAINMARHCANTIIETAS